MVCSWRLLQLVVVACRDTLKEDAQSAHPSSRHPFLETAAAAAPIMMMMMMAVDVTAVEVTVNLLLSAATAASAAGMVLLISIL